MKISSLLLPFVCIPLATAAELTLEAKPFSVSHSLKAVALPESAIALKLDTKSLPALEVVSLVDHGTKVKKGDSLVVFKSEGMDQKLADLKQAITAGELSLAQAELDLATLEKTTPEQLKRIEQQAKVASEELEYFTKTRREAEVQTADQSLNRQRQVLASYEEELKQLLKMYEADDITEDTEEIILKKQKDTVAYAAFLVEMEILDHKRKISVSLPREELALTEKRDDTALQLAKARQDLPRALELKKIEFAKLKTSLERQKKELTDLQHDRNFFEVKASEDGWFYHGAIENGTWTTAEMLKVLTPRGAVPAGKVFATLVPSGAKLLLYASASQADAVALQPQSKGFATLTGSDGALIPVSVAKVAPVPGADGTYRTSLAAEWPQSITPVSGQSYEVKIISYENEKAIAVPVKALDLDSKGWSVQVKLTDGKTERRTVTRGKASAETAEITAGLKPGDVVIVP